MPHLKFAKALLLAGIFSQTLSASSADAQRGARAGGGARSAPMSVNGARGGEANVNRNANANVNRNANVNVNRNVNVSGGYGHSGCCGGGYNGGVYHPVAAGMAVGAVTAAPPPPPPPPYPQ